jgi:hypothetical protein
VNVQISSFKLATNRSAPYAITLCRARRLTEWLMAAVTCAEIGCEKAASWVLVRGPDTADTLAPYLCTEHLQALRLRRWTDTSRYEPIAPYPDPPVLSPRVE